MSESLHIKFKAARQKKIKSKPLRKEKTMRIKTIAFFVFFIFIIGSLNLHSAMYANGSDCAFDPNLCNNNTSNGISIPFDLPNTVSDYKLKALIIDGAASFFDSTSYFLKFLKCFEIGSQFEMITALENSIDKMRYANIIYRELYWNSFFYSYNEVVINRLKSFDYDCYKDKFCLNPNVFEKVKCFLSKGDVRGIYNEIEKITGELISEMESLHIDEFPSKSAIWRVNQKITDAILFGQYVAEVFDQILK